MGLSSGTCHGLCRTIIYMGRRRKTMRNTGPISAKWPSPKTCTLALQHLRYKETDRVLWVDAICINQQNHLERGHQVRHMASIYRAAERVVIWLGVADDDSDCGMAFAKRVENYSLKYAFDKRTAPNSLLDSLSDDQTLRLYASLRSLLQRAWFRRVWILQEVANARVAEVVCGRKSVSARIFSLVPAFVGIVPDPHSQAVLDIMPGHSRESSWWAQKRDLQTLLVKFGKSEASDPRDHIFALLGISTDAFNTDLLKPNYENSIQEVIGNTLSFILRFHTSNPPIQFCPNWTLPQFLESLDSLGDRLFPLALKEKNVPLAMLLVMLNNVNWETWCLGFARLVPVFISTDVSLIYDGRYALLYAIQNGHIHFVKFLLDAGKVDANFKDHLHQTPLWYAVENGHETIVKLLLDTGKADLDSMVEGNRTPLWRAIQKEQSAIVKLLLDTGRVNLDSKDEKKNRTPFWHAIENGHDAIVKLFLDTGKVDLDAARR